MLISGLLALMRGFTREVLSLVAWGVAAVARPIFAIKPQSSADLAKQYVDQEILAKIAVGAGVFLIVLIIVSLISVKISDSVVDRRPAPSTARSASSMAWPAASCSWSSPICSMAGSCRSTGRTTGCAMRGPAPSSSPSATCRRRCSRLEIRMPHRTSTDDSVRHGPRRPTQPLAEPSPASEPTRQGYQRHRAQGLEPADPEHQGGTPAALGQSGDRSRHQRPTSNPNSVAKSGTDQANPPTRPDFDLDGDKLREECGVFGIFGHPDAAALTALGLHALQHRGQEAAGIVTFDGERFHAERRLGLVGDHFSKREGHQPPAGPLGHRPCPLFDHRRDHPAQCPAAVRRTRRPAASPSPTTAISPTA